MRTTLFIGILFLFTISLNAQQSLPKAFPPSVKFKYETVVPNLNNPWGMVFLKDGSLLISEKSGVLIHYENGIRNRVSNLPEVISMGQGGLLDIELHPNYQENGWIYISYSSPDGEEKGGNTALIRAKLKNNELVEIKRLYKASPNTNASVHWGSRIEFDDQGYVYFSIGDRYNRDNNPQSIKRDGGKIYRLHDDGKIPADNPFVTINGAKTAVYSYGHRNPQGMAKHPTTGQIWIHEHGPKGGDEINIIRKGKNYGWPVITYGKNYSGSSITDKVRAPNMEQPFYYWIPSIAPSGMTFVTSSKYPSLNGNILVGSLKFRYLEHLIITNGKVVKREKLLENIGRVRNVRQHTDGFIYVAVEGKGILKLLPK